MNPSHKTIICAPEDFDKEYVKWINSLALSPSQNFQKIDIKHEGNSHYILYIIPTELKRMY